ncbi:hypothetical protein AN639_04795 [Candidatus Epulonipiscium fishelsonii]|uniref:Uncharacterized protein n=1 Tax=Candidatus Epulonipiscium fishelsonii TaxID=77094 RepID=A0ACC8XDG4_9FIRM|nr:hypothetical protein AN639_04795 [Epulopiscium sp. SCG-B05WGA-EpuloA1]ONI40797.1 hypothetical protein AN396_05100 [Epulopiscium sp. SCG-B11WGA-EpuloA1]
MNSYLKNVLTGFISPACEVKLVNAMRKKANFLVMDVDDDGHPEILFCFNENGEEYIAILKKELFKWHLEYFTKQINSEAMLIYNTLEPINITKEWFEYNKDNINLDSLLQEEEADIISLIENELYGASITRMVDMTIQTIDYTQADVTGDGRYDEIFLKGKFPNETTTGYVTDMFIVVKNGITAKEVNIPIVGINSGYSPKLEIVDFNRDTVKDIMVTFTDGPYNPSYMYMYLYSVRNWAPLLLFEAKTFNNMSTGTVTYNDLYKLLIQTQYPSNQYQYSIDLGNLNPNYLYQLYDQYGNLIAPTFGTLGNVTNFTPIKTNQDAVYSLSALQPVFGENKDKLGTVETLMQWDNDEGKFVPFSQYLAIEGKPS